MLTDHITEAKKKSPYGNMAINLNGSSIKDSLKNRLKDYKAVISFEIKGIPCLIGVTHWIYKGPWRGNIYDCPSDLDWYGYEEIDYVILDRKGYKASWLEKKLTPDVASSIEEIISIEMRGLND